jgi:di/tricarboxylate transporter
MSGRVEVRTSGQDDVSKLEMPEVSKAVDEIPSTAVAPMGRVALISMGIGILVAIILLFVEISPGNPKVNRCASVCVLMATLWVTEAVPLAATSLFPLVAFPLLDVNTAAVYSLSLLHTHTHTHIYLYIHSFSPSLSHIHTHLGHRQPILQ